MKGKSAAIFKLKDDILGTKKAEQEAASLIHFKSGVELTNPKDIKGASLQYCVELLRNREPKSEFKVDVELKESVHMMISTISLYQCLIKPVECSAKRSENTSSL